MSRSPSLSLSALAATVMPMAARAHPGDHGAAQGLAEGILHPLSGADHLLAMVMVGVVAAQIGGRAVWIVPAAFLALMAVGGGLGALGLPLPLVEAGIAASVVVLGLSVALRRRWPLALAGAGVGLFAVFHGHAHGAEMPLGGGALFAAGFLIATALLHGLGLVIGSAAGGRRGADLALRSAGAVAGAAGIWMLSSAL